MHPGSRLKSSYEIEAPQQDDTTRPSDASNPMDVARNVDKIGGTIQPRFPQPLSDIQGHEFCDPQKRITSATLLQKFLVSDIAQDFLAFILLLNDEVQGRSLTSHCHVSPVSSALLSMLETLDRTVSDIPPSAHSLRYGNPAFRTWFSRLRSLAPSLVGSLLPGDMQREGDIIRELIPYLVDSFGNETRIDYGTGHETNFVAFLFCLAKLGVLKLNDASALVLKVFERYIILMRRLQTTYWLEPAGSHGVWGLDDYQFFPFIWGSSQLINHPVIMPHMIRDDKVLSEFSLEYMYLAAVSFVRQVKKGPLAETSPMLTDISAVPSWSKINKGMIKMYRSEVLGKFPIMQHFLFGSLIRFPT